MSKSLFKNCTFKNKVFRMKHINSGANVELKVDRPFDGYTTVYVNDIIDSLFNNNCPVVDVLTTIDRKLS